MKKAIIIIFCILTRNFFSVSYTLTSHKYFNHIVYAEKELPGFYSIQIPHDIMNNDSMIIRKEQHRQSHKVHHLYHQLHH